MSASPTLAAASRYADWKAPDEDGRVLIWPEPVELVRQTFENQRALKSSDAPVQGIPLRELRAAARKWIGHGEIDQPLIATGHQAELYHPGVWVKHAMINSIARVTSGQAYQLGVDTDAPKHLHLRWPGGSLPISDDVNLSRAPWAGLVDGPTPAHVDEIEAEFRKASAEWGFESCVGEFLASLKRGALNEPNLPSAIINATHALDWRLGLKHHALTLSPVWMSPPFLTYAHDLLARADELAGAYNGALADYRAEQGIASPGRPMPDLPVSADLIESPFWLDDLSDGTRQRLSLKRTPAGWALRDFMFSATAPGEVAAEKLLAWLRLHNLRIAPRALTLTLYLRLFLADQFVHGIGGGRYDQVTDRIIHAFYGVNSPAFSVTTATLFFPAAAGQKRVSLRPLLQEGRRIRHGSFSREKRAMASAISNLPRRSADRSARFFEMHRWLAQQVSSPAMTAWQQQMDHALAEQLRQKAVFDRELFFAIQPEDRLRGIINRYDTAFAIA